MINQIIIFILGLLPLLYFSWKDLKYNQINNIPIFIYTILSLIVLFVFQSSQFIQLIIILTINFGVFYFLWIKNSIGGADLKIITAILIFSLINTPNILVAYLFFIVILLIIGAIYYIYCKIFLINKEVPFIPLFTLLFIIMSYLKLVWL